LIQQEPSALCSILEENEIMVNQSKFLSCEKALHPGFSCDGASARILRDAFVSAAKIYLPLFFIGSLGSKKITDWRYVAFRLIPNVLRSSLFISVIGSLWCRLACVGRNQFGMHYRISYFIAPFIASWIGIIIEKKERRHELAVYVANQAVEAIWRVLESRGVVKQVKNGILYLFCISMGFLLYFQKNEPSLLSGSTRTLLRLFIGAESFPDAFEQRVERIYFKITDFVSSKILRRKPTSRRKKIHRIDSDSHSESKSNQICFHGRGGCAPYITIGFLRSFLLGVVIRCLFLFLPFLLTPKKLGKQVPKLLEKSSWSLAMFLGILGGGSRLIQCALRRIRGTEDGLNQFIAGAIVGLAFKFNQSTEVAMYVASKAAESIYFMMVNRGLIKPFPHGETITFSAATGFLFFVALLEPQNVRPSYRKFLTRASGGWWPSIAGAFTPVRKAIGIPSTYV